MSERTCVSEQGKSGLLWTVFEGEPFASRRIASFAEEQDARDYLFTIPRQFADLEARNARLSKALEEALEWLRSTPEGRFTPQVNNQPGLWAFHADAALTVSDRKAGERLRKLELVARRAESWRIINESFQCSEFEEDAALEYLRSALTDLAAVGAASAKDD